jgi:hypothetical protein
MDSEFPPNSVRAKMESSGPDTPEDKKVEAVVKGEVKRRKKPLGRRFTETFLNGDAKGTAQYVLFGVLIPAAKDMLVEAGSQGIERLVFGETRRRSASRGPNPMGHIAYNRPPGLDRPPAAQMSHRARARHDFDEIILQSRGEAEEVLDRMYDLLSRYDSVSVADLYELTGIQSAHTDQKWGWVDLRGSGVSRTRTGGFVLDLPEPTPLG